LSDSGAATGGRIRWAGGGEARLVSITADAIVLRSTVPFPPGARIEGALEDDPSATVRLKVHVSRRQPEGEFLVEGRPLDLTRRVRERLSAVSVPSREERAAECTDEDEDH
jgi:hypothetical protein